MLLAEAMHRESRYAVLPFAPEKLRALMAHLIDSPSGFLQVACSGGEIVGFMAAFVAEHFASSAKIAGDYGLFIGKDHRGGGSAARLLKAFKAWAEAQGAVLLHAGISTGVAMESTTKFYQSMGFKQVGVVFELGSQVCA